MKELHVSSWIIIDEHKRILLIKRGIQVEHNKNYWATPSGKQDPWENFEQTAVREVKEETGLIFYPQKLYIEDESRKDSEIIKKFHRYLWYIEWEIKLQKEECDGYGWFHYQETKRLLLTENMKLLLQKLYSDSLIL